jgi:EAL domain-containing protein (putative c-di-GMP-specific phosphodiesterase class I)
VTHDFARQRRLTRHYLFERGSASRLDSTVALAASSLGFPHGQINILDDATQHTISSYGMGPDVADLDRTETICHFTLEDEDVLAVDDLPADPRFAAVPGVADGTAGSYLGVPLASRESSLVGTLCLLDRDARPITSEQIAAIRRFGRIVEDQLDLLRRRREHTAHRPASDSVAAELAAALENGEIVPWYQPIVDLGTDRLVGYEALARWQSPSGELRDPSRFIPLAEDSDLVVDVDRAVMRQALMDLARWHRTRPNLEMNINISTRHLELPDGVSSLHAATVESGVKADAIHLELTETRQLSDEDSARTAVHELRALGYRVLLDDFGAGWSSLDWILRLPVTGLKIDRVVTAGLGSTTGNAINRAVVALADELGLVTVIEGISTRGHLDLASALGYRDGQGYYWSPPVPADRIDAA